MLDVAIVGGGPAGSTVGTLLKKYNPRLNVTILERERFPRDHVGESQLPIIGTVLDEMECWQKVENAGFPIKVGATYKWGRTPDLWDFHFVENGALTPEPRPAHYQGQRRRTAFQVDRAIYDKILLDHAATMGCLVRQESPVRRVDTDTNRIGALALDGGERIQARWYVDASGHSGILRRALGIGVVCPTSLQNVAVWDYWQNAEWMESVGVGGTRILIMSLGFGWIWFIPLGPTRTSIGLVVPVEYLKASGKRPEELYIESVTQEPLIARLVTNAEREGKLSTTKDWSFVAQKMAGPNWFLAGESAGFADPILSAGMSLAHTGGRDVAYAILAALRGDYDADWLAEWYDASHRKAVGQHIKFADFWYASNGCFTDLINYTAEIARDAGLNLEPDQAWQWLGTGGFIDHNTVGGGFGGYTVGLAKQISGNFLGTGSRYETEGMNLFKLNLEGADKDWGATLENGRLSRHRAFRRGDRYLPNVRLFSLLISATRNGATLSQIEVAVQAKATELRMNLELSALLHQNSFEALETMTADGWVEASRDPSRPGLRQPEGDLAIVGPRDRDKSAVAL